MSLIEYSSFAQRIDRDVERFKKIIKGKIRDNLGKYITHDKLIGRQGSKPISIPIPGIDTPQFRHGRGVGGVGQGDGNVGDPIGRGDPGSGNEPGAGTEPGHHAMEVEVTIDEILELIMERIHLPYLLPRGINNIEELAIRVKGVQTAPTARYNYKRSLKQALRHGIPIEQTHEYVREPGIARYDSFDTQEIPKAQAVLIFMMDISGSMSQEKKEIARIIAYWTQQLIAKIYPHVEVRFIAHDTQAREVTEEYFYGLTSGGGTAISSAYKLCEQLIQEKYPMSDWNIYPFHFSDGENFANDNQPATQIARAITQVSRQFSFIHIVSGTHVDEQFLQILKKDIPAPQSEEEGHFVHTRLKQKDQVLSSIIDLLGKKN